MKHTINNMIKRLVALCFAGGLLANATLSTANDSSDIALVVVNDAYSHAPITKARTSGKLVAKLLKQRGFDVTVVENATSDRLLSSVNGLYERAIDTDGVILFHYIGHSLPVDGVNYLLPVDIAVQSDVQVKYEGDAIEDVLAPLVQATETGGGNLLAVFDAGRSDPLGLGSTSGYAPIATTPTNSLVLFSAKPGSVADQGVTFSQGWNAALRSETRDIVPLIKSAQKHIVVKSGNAPHYTSSLTASIAFGSPPKTTKTSASNANDYNSLAKTEKKSRSSTNAAATTCTDALDKTLWEAVSDSKDIASVQSYLDRFPQGCSAVAAQEKLAELQSSKPEDNATILSKEDEEAATWKKLTALAKQTGDACVFSEYLKFYPNGAMSIVAKKKLQNCASYNPNAQQTQSIEIATVPAATAGDVKSLVKKAQAALRNDACITPQAQSVWLYTSQVLASEPEHKAAVMLQRACATKYLSWGEKARDNENRAKAMANLGKLGKFKSVLTPQQRERQKALVLSLRNPIAPTTHDTSTASTPTPQSTPSANSAGSLFVEDSSAATTPEPSPAQTKQTLTEKPESASSTSDGKDENAVQRAFRKYMENRDGGISGQDIEHER